MIDTKTHKVKVWDHTDAVVYVYETRYEKTNPDNKECHKYKHWNNLITAIPMEFGYELDLTQADKVNKVQAVVDALYEVYTLETDGYEISISYLINNLKSINA